MYGYLRKIIPFSSVDGKGNRCAIFLQGCNMNCLYCHNPETIERKDMENIKGVRKVKAEEVFNECIKYKPFISGVTISGGECTTQLEFLIDLASLFHRENISVYIDTNGLFSKEAFISLEKIIEGFMFDIKAFKSEDHKLLTGVNNDLILSNFETALKNKKLIEVRSVIIPSIIDNEYTVSNVGKIIATYNKDILYKLIKFRNIGVKGPLENHISPSDKYMEKLKKICEDTGAKNILII